VKAETDEIILLHTSPSNLSSSVAVACESKD